MRKIINTLLAVVLFGVSLSSFAEGEININTAGLKALSTLENIGRKKAQMIIDYRESSGLFEAIEELAKVAGIGKKSVEANRERITVESTDK